MRSCSRSSPTGVRPTRSRSATRSRRPRCRCSTRATPCRRSGSRAGTTASSRSTGRPRSRTSRRPPDRHDPGATGRSAGARGHAGDTLGPPRPRRRCRPLPPCSARAAREARGRQQTNHDTNSAKEKETTMVLFTTTSKRVWMVSLAVSLGIFAVLYFTVIRPDNNAANNALRTGLQQSQQIINNAQKQLSQAENGQAGANAAAQQALNQAKKHVSSASSNVAASEQQALSQAQKQISNAQKQVGGNSTAQQ